MPRSRSFTRFTIRVGLEHLGQSVLLLVSMTFLRSPVLVIFAMLLDLLALSGGATRDVPRGRSPWISPGLRRASARPRTRAYRGRPTEPGSVRYLSVYMILRRCMILRGCRGYAIPCPCGSGAGRSSGTGL